MSEKGGGRLFRNFGNDLPIGTQSQKTLAQTGHFFEFSRPQIQRYNCKCVRQPIGSLKQAAIPLLATSECNYQGNCNDCHHMRAERCMRVPSVEQGIHSNNMAHCKVSNSSLKRDKIRFSFTQHSDQLQNTPYVTKIKQPECKTDLFYLPLTLKMNGATAPLPHTSSYYSFYLITGAYLFLKPCTF